MSVFSPVRGLLLSVALLATGSHLLAEDGSAGWLRYAPLPQEIVAKQYASFPSSVVVLDD
jgi:hypothetical protein